MDELYRGWAGAGGGWEAEGGQHHPQGDKQQCCVFSRAQKLPQSTWQAQMVVSSSLTPQAALLVHAHQWPHRPSSGPYWFYRVCKRPPVKADLANYSLVVGMSGQWVNVATMLNYKLDFYCCDNSVGFCKSSQSHILVGMYPNYCTPLTLCGLGLSGY